jgi:periplasmic protein CpxP/Spy
MKKPMKLLLIATIVSGAVAAGVAYAMPGGERCMRGGHPMGMGHAGHGMDAERHIDRMADALDLTKEQRDQVRSIVDKSRPATRELQDRLRDNRKQLHALMQQDTVSEKEVRRLADIQGKAIADTIVLRTRVQTDIRSILTPEQRQKMQTHFGQRDGFHAMQDDQELDRHSDAGPTDEQSSGSEKTLARRVSM